jgi:TPR repeat protein
MTVPARKLAALLSMGLLTACSPYPGTQPVTSSYEAHSVQLFQEAANRGDPGAMVNLGIMYEAGRGGLEKDEAEAARLYRKAADLGDARAMTNLAILYVGGRGVPQDDRAAAELLKPAARQNYEPARRYLAALFVTGRGNLSPDDHNVRASVLFEAAKGEVWAKQPAAEMMAQEPP